MNPQKHYYIAVAGILGSGKTTVAKLLAHELGFALVEDAFETNAFLPLFYKDPHRWAFHNQLFYLHDTVRQNKVVREMLEHTSVVHDEAIYQHYFTYSKAQLALGNMLPTEFALYDRYAQVFWKDAPTPDLIIQLDASVPVLAERIRKRSRDFEQEIDMQYLETLSGLQKEWLQRHQQFPVLSVATDYIDLAENAEDRKLFCLSVRRRLGLERV